MNKHLTPETRNVKPETMNPDSVFIPQSAFRNSQSNRSLLHASEGTTLIEVLMASVIFMIGMLALLGMQVTAMHSNKIGSEITEATSLVSDQIERLWGLNLTSSELTVGVHNDPNNPVNNQGQAGGKYIRQWIVTGDGPNSNSRFVQVRVTWNDVWAKVRKVEFTGMR